MSFWLVFSLPGLHLGPAPAPRPADRWWARDKAYHVAASAVVQGAAYAVGAGAATVAIRQLDRR